MSGQDKIFISGFPRAGTSVMRRLLISFEGCRVNVKVPEEHPIIDTTDYNVKKQPFGYFKRFAPKYSYEELINEYGYKIISMVRDPRDVLVSIHKSKPDDYWVEPRIVIRNCREYLRNVNNRDVLFIRYEHLVTNVVEQLDKIANFIGHPYGDDYKNWYKFPDEEANINLSLNSPRPLDTSSIGNWNKPEHVERIKAVMTDELRYFIVKLGYRL